MTSPPKRTAPNPPRARVRARSPHLAHGRWYGDFKDLSPGEQRLVECCARGKIWVPLGWDWKNPQRPTEKTNANTIRAELIRFLALGGDADHGVHELGVMAHGAWIAGTLDLGQCHATVRFVLPYCHFDAVPNFMATHLPELALSGAKLPGLDADGMKVMGSVFLGDGFTATGQVHMLGAQIGGDLNCSNGSFANGDWIALNADRMKVTGSVFLGDHFTVTGRVHLRGAEIGGDLDCSEARFAKASGYTLNADAVRVSGSLFLYRAKIEGAISLSAAYIGSLGDDADCWKASGHIIDGLHYDRIVSLTDAASRIAWLKTQHAAQLDYRDWKPQPWEQLIKVLREMGHPGAAAEVAMEKQRMMRAAGQIGTRQPRTDFKWAWRRWLDAQWNRFSNQLGRGFHSFYGWVAGYGYRPTRIIWKMTMLWLACALCFEAGREFGYFGPNSTPIQTNTAFDACGAPGDVQADGRPKHFWHTPGCKMPPEHTRLFTPLYSLDLILPPIDLQQDGAWAPIVVNERGEQLWAGYALRALMWFETLFGWLASLMFIAIVSRLVKVD